MKLNPLAASIGLTVLGLAVSVTSFAESKADLNADAARTLKHLYVLNSGNHALAGKAAGVLIFPHVTKGGAGIAGEYGEGVLQLNGRTVSYYSIGSASVGLTLGVGQHSEVLMFMTQKSLEQFQDSDGWSAGADSGVVLVSDGEDSQYASTTSGKPILGFIFGEKGLLADASLEGTKITKITTAGR